MLNSPRSLVCQTIDESFQKFVAASGANGANRRKWTAGMTWLSDPDAWSALAALLALEIVLGVDNVIFISILAS